LLKLKKIEIELKTKNDIKINLINFNLKLADTRNINSIESFDSAG